MPTISLVLAGTAALLHVGFFYLEAIGFRTPAVRKLFGATDDAAFETLRVPMLNQGYYNLLLAIGTGVGVIGTFNGWKPQGPTLVVFGCLFMIGAAVVLVASRRSLWRGALAQGIFPALALIVALFAA